MAARGTHYSVHCPTCLRNGADERRRWSAIFIWDMCAIVRFVRRVVNKLLTLQSDIVFVAGDLYDGVAADFEKLARPWADLVASPQAAALGVYYIAGNHEEFYRNAEYLPPLLRAGIRVLNNEKVEVDGLQLIGVHYGDAVNADQYRSILRSMKLDRGRASVLLLHAPVRLPISEEEGISLQLSGHTHGGQFFPWTLIAQRVWHKFIHGLQRFGALQVYTTYGTGTWGPPLRAGHATGNCGDHVPVTLLPVFIRA